MTFGASENPRGRENYVPTGRGGAGNAIRSPSRGRPAESVEDAKKAADYQANQNHVRAGRGGAGNVRSPSRDPVDREKYNEIEKKEHALQADAIKRDQMSTHSSGRGGMGNMSHRDDSPRGRENGVTSAIRSLSRSRSREPRSSSQQRVGASTEGERLSSVDETSTLNSHPEKQHQGFVSKLASHLPSSHHHNS